jgi:hypothetical protein
MEIPSSLALIRDLSASVPTALTILASATSQFGLLPLSSFHAIPFLGLATDFASPPGKSVTTCESSVFQHVLAHVHKED